MSSHFCICVHCGAEREKYRIAKPCPKRNDGGQHFWIRRTQVDKECWKVLQNPNSVSDAEYMYHVANCYNITQNPQDEETAVMWYQKAANLGNEKAMFALAEIYRAGKVVPKDIEKAVFWYKKAAEIGCADAMATLGDIYAAETNFPQNVTEAKAWYQKAADLGHVQSMLCLSEIYQNDNNMDKSVCWRKRAAETGNRDSVMFLGYMYEIGTDLPQDIEEAEKWYQKASDAGDKLGKLGLGRLCELKNENIKGIEIYKELAESVASPPLGLPYIIDLFGNLKL